MIPVRPLNLSVLYNMKAINKFKIFKINYTLVWRSNGMNILRMTLVILAASFIFAGFSSAAEPAVKKDPNQLFYSGNNNCYRRE